MLIESLIIMMTVICDQDFTKILTTLITKGLSNYVLLIKTLYFEHSCLLDSIEIEKYEMVSKSLVESSEHELKTTGNTRR